MGRVLSSLKSKPIGWFFDTFVRQFTPTSNSKIPLMEIGQNRISASERPLPKKDLQANLTLRLIFCARIASK